MPALPRRKAGSSAEEDRLDFASGQGRLEEGAGRRRGWGALDLGMAVCWQQQRNPGVSGCGIDEAQKVVK